MLNNLKPRAKKLQGYLFKLPAFLYKEDEAFLERFTLSEWSEYELWLFRNRNFTLHKLKNLYKKAINFKIKPKISIIMPVYNPDPNEFKQAIDSVLWQAYSYWELCIVDDYSDNRDYLKVLGRLIDRRIKIKIKNRNTGIADTSQNALEMATGEYIALMDQDDEIYPDALYSFVNILQHREIDYFYSDKDLISPQGKRYMHFFKPDWSPEYLLSCNYVSHLEIYNKSLVLDVGGFRKDYEGSQDYDLTLRVTEQTSKIYHYPMVLYSWRQSQGNATIDPEKKSYAFESAIRALNDTIERRDLPAKEVVEDRNLCKGFYKIIWDDEILTNRKIYLITVCRGLSETNRLRYLFKDVSNSLNIEFVSTDYNIENINRVLKDIPHEGYIFFCDDNVVEIVSDGLIDMLGYLSIDGVGVAGCKFLDQNNNIFNAGLSITSSGNILFPYKGSFLDEVWYGAMTTVPRNVSLVFPSFWGCKSTLLQENGYLENNKGYFHSIMNFFKSIIISGEEITCVPYMCLKVEKDKLDYKEEMKVFLDQWLREGLKDRYYNLNLHDIYENNGIKLL